MPLPSCKPLTMSVMESHCMSYIELQVSRAVAEERPQQCHCMVSPRGGAALFRAFFLSHFWLVIRTHWSCASRSCSPCTGLASVALLDNPTGTWRRKWTDSSWSGLRVGGGGGRWQLSFLCWAGDEQNLYQFCLSHFSIWKWSPV